ncbi:hypothetical protein SCHPADRAFT_301676 [Schizopora paradoxa]|uniref:Uncharacterized protein n=1 Tax=Schizopora paradoxa TaxID=27342 RepID=A0A0H2RS41_9AGAM|nr:hypothetical protein SCHPADRAFT_301676 [Schizopora paradoxa]
MRLRNSVSKAEAANRPWDFYWLTSNHLHEMQCSTTMLMPQIIARELHPVKVYEMSWANMIKHPDAHWCHYQRPVLKRDRIYYRRMQHGCFTFGRRIPAYVGSLRRTLRSFRSLFCSSMRQRNSGEAPNISRKRCFEDYHHRLRKSGHRKNNVDSSKPKAIEPHNLLSRITSVLILIANYQGHFREFKFSPQL